MNNWSSKPAHVWELCATEKHTCAHRLSNQKLRFRHFRERWPIRAKIPLTSCFGSLSPYNNAGNNNKRVADVCNARNRWRLGTQSLDYTEGEFISTSERNVKSLCVGIYIRRIRLLSLNIINHKAKASA